MFYALIKLYNQYFPSSQLLHSPLWFDSLLVNPNNLNLAKGSVSFILLAKECTMFTQTNYSRVPDTSGENNKVTIVAMFSLPESKFPLVQGLLNYVSQLVTL